MDEPIDFRALWVEEQPDSRFTRRIITRSTADLPPGDVLIRVLYSSLNYKDALSASGNKSVTRHYPHTPGIDAAGIVEESANPAFAPGDEVVAMGYELGVSIPGSYGQYIRVPAGWVMKIPQGLSLKESMAYGTAGYTAALCVLRLNQEGVTPEKGEVLVTGATGGVGAFAVAMLAREGYRVVAATGKLQERPFLEALGATEVIDRQAARDTGDRPLLKGRWAGCVDTVGGDYLSTALRATQPGGCVACCGNAASADLHLTVYPFILRGVTLAGIESPIASPEVRREAWQNIAGKWKVEPLDRLYREVPLDQLEGEIERILHGGQTGRVVVDLWK